MLDDDTLSQVFLFLDSKELCNVMLTCKQWHNVCMEDTFWKEPLVSVYRALAKHKYDSEHNVNFYAVRRRREYEPGEVILEETDNFREHFVRLSRNYKRSIVTFRNAKKNGVAQFFSYVVIFVTALLAIVCYAFVMPILFMLYMDGYIAITVQNIYWSLIAYLFLVFIPTLISLGACAFLVVLYVKRLRAEKLLRSLDITISPTKQSLIDHTIILSYTSCLGIFPLLHFCVYLRYWVTNTFVWVPYSFTLTTIPFLAYCLANIFVPFVIFAYVQGVLEHKESTRLKMYMHSYPILFNLYAILQTLLVSTKLDGVLNTYWTVVFIPSAIICFAITLLSLCTYPVAKLASDRPPPFSEVTYLVGYLNVIFWCSIFLLIPAITTFILFVIRLDLFINIPYLYTFIPLFVEYGLILCIVGLVLLYPVISITGYFVQFLLIRVKQNGALGE
jgi:hypothetical protein